MGEKYNLVQKRLGDLDVNDDIMRDDYIVLQKLVKELSAELKEVKKDRKLLKVRNNRLEREAKDLRAKLHKVGNKGTKQYKLNEIVDKFGGKINSN